ncbi:MAG TPA: glycosyltransferase family 39 protein [Solirubrobacteraceae bacterium]
MSSTEQTATAPAASPAAGTQPAPGRRAAWRRRVTGVRPGVAHLGFVAVVVLSAVLNTHRLAQNGYANIFYSAGDRSMLRSLHNFFFVSFDPGGLVSVDKPPLALWLQAASAKLFGFTPLSLLLPEAIVSVLAVALLYVILTRRLGVLAAFAGAVAMAVFPSFVAVSRENGVDPLLILLMVMACGAALRASETGRWRALLWSAVLVGLAFNTKTLAAVLVIPGIALAYLVCAPGTLVRRVGQLLVAGLVMAVVAFSWILYVDATPASKRPYVGSSTNNTEIGLTFEYNGLGRVEGQTGAPNTVQIKPGARVPAPKHGLGAPAPASKTKAAQPATSEPGSQVEGKAIVPVVERKRNRYPIPFGGPPGPLRLFGVGLGDQAGWMLPFAFFGLVGMALMLALSRRRDDDAGAEAATTDTAAAQDEALGRRDPRLASAIVLGGWLLVEAFVLSTSTGIVHPYYVSALAPGTGAMAGAGLAALVTLARGKRRLWALALAPIAVAATLYAQLYLMHRYHYMVWFEPILVAGALVGLGAFVALRRMAAPALIAVFALLLIVPTGYAASTWLAPVEGTFPAAGPRQAPGAPGGFGISRRDLDIDRAIAEYVHAHRPGTRWELLTVASDTVAPIMLLGYQAGALGGYSGTDPALDGPGLARLVAGGEARYVLLGGEYSSRGGNKATAAVLKVCRQISPRTWHSPVPYPFGLTLFDCAGRSRALSSA